MESHTYANIPDIKQLQMEDLKNTKSLCMIELNALAKFEVIMQLEGKIWPDTKSQCIIESNTLANIAAIKQIQTGVSKNIKEIVSETIYTTFVFLRPPSEPYAMLRINRYETFIRELLLPYNKTVRKIGNTKVFSHEEESLCKKRKKLKVC